MIKVLFVLRGSVRSMIFKMNLSQTQVNRDIKTFIFLDLETTGLPQMEYNRTKITELTLISVQADHIRLGVFPRVLNKLSLCLNPGKLISLESSRITGLYNDLLEHQSHFSLETGNAINSFLNHSEKPLCFVAHNGNYFDYPILQAEISKSGITLPEDILCIDSLEAFRSLYEPEITQQHVQSESKTSIPIEFSDGYDELLCSIADKLDPPAAIKVSEVQKANETTPKRQPIINNQQASSRRRLNFGTSFKLVDVFTRLTSKPPINEHHAEGDVIMLISCTATLGDKFVDWANRYAKKFCDIPPMTPGVRIGTFFTK